MGIIGVSVAWDFRMHKSAVMGALEGHLYEAEVPDPPDFGFNFMRRLFYYMETWLLDRMYPVPRWQDTTMGGVWSEMGVRSWTRLAAMHLGEPRPEPVLVVLCQALRGPQPPRQTRSWRHTPDRPWPS